MAGNSPALTEAIKWPFHTKSQRPSIYATDPLRVQNPDVHQARVITLPEKDMMQFVAEAYQGPQSRRDIRQRKRCPTVTCPYQSPAMRFTRSGYCVSRRPWVRFSLALFVVWSASEAHNCASASYRIKCPVVTASRPRTIITAAEWLESSGYKGCPPPRCPSCQSCHQWSISVMLLFATRVGYVYTLRVHVGVKSFHRQNFCQCFGHVHPCSWYPLVDPCWTSLGAAEPGVCQV